MEKIQNYLLGDSVAKNWKLFQEQNVYKHTLDFLYNRFGFSCIFVAVFVAIISLHVGKFWEFSLLIIYLLHQFEEHAFPGGFVTFVNMNIIHSTKSLSPIKPSFIFWTNCVFVWMIFLYEQVSGPQFPKIDQNIPYLSLGICIVNALTHIIAWITLGYYNPGLITACFLLIPWSGYYIYRYSLLKNDSSRNKLWLGIGIAILLHLFLIVCFYILSKKKIKLKSFFFNLV